VYRSRDDAKADVFETPALDDWIFKPYGVRAAGGISLSGCQPNRVQLTHDGRIIEDLILEERLDGMIDRAIRRLAQGKMMKQVAGLTKDYPERAPSVPLKIVGPKKKRANPKTK
jgi:hypothetical protein